MSKSLINKLAAEEKAFMDSEVLAPVVRGLPIRVRIAGVVMVMNVSQPRDFQGWGIFKPISFCENSLILK